MCKQKQAAGGFTIIEVLIATFVIGVVVVGLFGLFVLSLRTAQDSERRIVAVALANEKTEMIRNLPYVNVGTSGGIPTGSILQEEEVVRSGMSYTVRTDIRYVDDPYDGVMGGSPSDMLNTDYKQVRVEVSWNSPMSSRPILLITTVAPSGIEGGDEAGTLMFQVLNANGVGIQDATVRFVNSLVSPSIDMVTNTNEDGYVVIPGLPESADSYELSVFKDGYTSEQTYDVTGTFSPSANYMHLTMLQGEVAEKVFFIDRVGSLTLRTQDESGQAIPDAGFAMRGTKTIGTDENEDVIYMFGEDGVTDASGTAQYEDMVWDSYDVVFDDYDIKETSQLFPFVVFPGEDVAVDITLVDHTNLSLHVTVVAVGDVFVDNATVVLTRGGYEEEFQTGALGQVFFPDVPGVGEYSWVVDASGYAQVDGDMMIETGERIQVDLSVEE